MDAHPASLPCCGACSELAVLVEYVEGGAQGSGDQVVRSGLRKFVHLGDSWFGGYALTPAVARLPAVARCDPVACEALKRRSGWASVYRVCTFPSLISSVRSVSRESDSRPATFGRLRAPLGRREAAGDRLSPKHGLWS